MDGSLPNGGEFGVDLLLAGSSAFRHLAEELGIPPFRRGMVYEE